MSVKEKVEAFASGVDSELKPGDVATLKSGGLELTVGALDGPFVVVLYSMENEIVEKRIPAWCLTKRR